MPEHSKFASRDAAHGGPLARQSIFSPPEERDGLALLADSQGGDPSAKDPKQGEIPDITPQILQLLGPLVAPELREGGGALSLEKLAAKEFKTYAAFKKFLCDQAAINDDKVFRNPYESLLEDDYFVDILSLVYEKLNPAATRLGDSKKAALRMLPEFQSRLVAIDAEAFARNLVKNDSGRENLRHLLKHPTFLTKDQKADLIKGIYEVADGAKVLSSWERHTVSSNINPWNYFNLGVSHKNLDAAAVGAEFMVGSIANEEERATEIGQELLEKVGPHFKTHNGQRFEKISAKRVKYFQNLFNENQASTGAKASAVAKLAHLWLWAADERNMQAYQGLSQDQTHQLQHHLMKQAESLIETAENMKTREALLEFQEQTEAFLQDPIPWQGENATLNWVSHQLSGESIEDYLGELPEAYRGVISSLKQQNEAWGYSVREMGAKIRIEPWELEAKDPKFRKQLAGMMQGLEDSKHQLWYGYKQHKFISRAGSNVAEVFNGGDIQDIEAAQITLNALMQQLSQVKEPEDLKPVFKDLIEELSDDGTLYQAMQAAEMDGTEQLLGLAQTCGIMMALAAATRGLSLAAEGTGALARFGGMVRSSRVALDGYGKLGTMTEGAIMGAALVTTENALAVTTGEVRHGPETVGKWFKDAIATGAAMGLSAGLLKLPKLDAGAQQNLAKQIWARYTTGGIQGLKHLAADMGIEVIEEATDQYIRQVLDGDYGALTEAELTELTLICFAGGPAKSLTLVEHLKAAQASQAIAESKSDSNNDTDTESLNELKPETPANDNAEATVSPLESPLNLKVQGNGEGKKQPGNPLPWAAAAGLTTFLTPEIAGATTEAGNAMAPRGSWWPRSGSHLLEIVQQNAGYLALGAVAMLGVWAGKRLFDWWVVRSKSSSDKLRVDNADADLQTVTKVDAAAKNRAVQEKLEATSPDENSHVTRLAQIVVAAHDQVAPLFAEQGRDLTLRDMLRSVDVLSILSLQKNLFPFFDGLHLLLTLPLSDPGQREAVLRVIENLRRSHGATVAKIEQDFRAGQKRSGKTGSQEPEYLSDTDDRLELRTMIQSILAQADTSDLSSIYKAMARHQGMDMEIWLGRVFQEAATEELQQLFRELGWDSLTQVSWIKECCRQSAVLPILEAALQDRLFPVRREAAEALGRLGDPSAIPALAAALGDSSVDVRSAAAEALGRLDDPSAIPALKGALLDSDGDVRYAAVEALERLGDPSAIPALEAALGDSNWDVRRAAAEALGQLGDPSAIPALERALQDSSEYVRINAAEALGRLGDPSAISVLERALQDSSEYVRINAAAALGRLGDPSAIPALKDALQNSDSSVRYAAAEALGRLGDPSAISVLERALQDSSWDVRSVAAEALGRLGDPSAIPALKRALQDLNWPVRRAAAEALGRLGDPSVIPALKCALQDSSEYVRINAAEALGRLGDPSAIPALKDALQNSDSSVRYAAAEALGRLGDPSAIPALKRALQDLNVDVRRAAADALGRLSDPSAIPLLKRSLQDSDEVVRIYGAAALDQLSPGWDQGIQQQGQAALKILSQELNRQVSAIETESSESLGENLSHLPPWSGRDSHNKSFSATKLQELKAFIPAPEKLTLVGPTVEALKGLMAGILSNTPVYLMAVTGVGKNAMLRYLANRTGTPLYRINFGKDTDHGQLYGHFEVEVYENEAGEKKKRIVIQDGKMIEAIKNGGWCLWDEANLASEAFLVAQNDIIQQLKTGTVRVRQGGKLVTVPVHPHFRLFAAGNPEGYAARRPTEQSFGSRWLQVAVREFRVEEQQAILRDTLGTSLSPESVEHIPQVLHALKLATGGEAVTLRTLKRVAKRIGEVESNTEVPITSEPSTDPSAGPRSSGTLRSHENNSEKAGQEESPVHGASLWTHDASGRRQLSEFGIKAYVQAFESEVLDALSGDQHQNAVQALEQALARGEREIAPYLNSTPTQESFEQSVQDYRQEVQAKQATPVINSPHWEDLVPVPTTLKYAAKVLDSLRRGDNVLLEGPPAVSKSAIPKWLGKLLQQEVIGATGSPDHSSADMVGMPTLDERGNLVFQEGYVLRAIKSGAILILNEANLIPTEVMERLNSLLDDERMLMVTENGAKVPVKAHPNFRVVFTQNPAKMRGGRKQHSPAFENKVRKIAVREDFAPEELEAIVSATQPQLQAVAGAMVAFHREAAQIFQSEDTVLTLRDLQRWGMIATSLTEQGVLAPGAALLLGAELVYPGRSLNEKLSERFTPVVERLREELNTSEQATPRKADPHAELRTVIQGILAQEGTSDLLPIYTALARHEGMGVEIWLSMVFQGASSEELRQLFRELGWDMSTQVFWIASYFMRPAAIPALEAALRDSDRDVRRAAAEALGKLDDTTAVPALEAALHNPDKLVRGTVAYALGELGDPAAIPALEAALRDSDDVVQLDAAKALGELGDPAARPVLEAALEDSNEYMRRAAAEALGKLGDPAATPALEAALRDLNMFVRSAAAGALGKLGDPAARPVLEAALRDSKEDVRRAATYALGELGDPAAIPALEAALRDSEKFVRRAAAEALGKLGDPAARPVLEATLRDSDKYVRRDAAEALGKLGDPAAIPVLEAALRDLDGYVRINAADALGKLGDPAAIPALEAALRNSHVWMRSTAAYALGELGDPAAIPALKAALHDSNGSVRSTAAYALGRLGDPAARPALEAALRDSDEGVRIYAARALDKLFPGWDQEIRMKGQAALKVLFEELNRQVSDLETESSAAIGENLSLLPPWSGRNSKSQSFSAKKLQELKAFIPGPENLSLVGPTVEALKGLMAGIFSNTPVYLMAVTGVGKNAMLRYLANRTGTPLYRINFGKDTDHGQLYGHFEVEVYENEAGEKKKRIVIQDGKMIEAIKNGGWCLWDEANLASEAFLVAQNDIIQQLKTGTVRVRQGGKLVTVPVHPHFRLFAAGNPEGYAARRPTEQSFGSRWLQVAVREFRVEEQQAILRDTLGTSLSPESVEHIPQVLHALKLATGGEAVTLRTLKRVAKRIGEVEAAGQEESPVHGASLWTHDASGRRQLSEFGIKAYVQAFESEVLDALSGDQHQNAVQALEQALARGEREIAPYLNSTLTQESFEQSLQDYRQEVQAKQAIPVINSPHWEDLVPVPTTLKYAAKVLDSLRRGDNVLLEGPPAVSKSAIPKWLGKLLQQEVIEATGSPDHSSADMVGMPTLDERGNLVFQEGYVLRAIKSGAILILNEANLIPAEVMERLNSLLDDERMLMVTENGAKVPVKAHPNFRVVFTQNPAKMRGGRKQHSPAFENKVRKIAVREDFAPEELEAIVSATQPQLQAVAGAMVAFHREAAQIFQSEDTVLTLRDLQRWGMIATSLTEQGVLAPGAALLLGAELVYPGRSLNEKLSERFTPVVERLRKDLHSSEHTTLRKTDPHAELRGMIQSILAQDETSDLTSIYTAMARHQGMDMNIWLGRMFQEATTKELQQLFRDLGWDSLIQVSWIKEYCRQPAVLPIFEAALQDSVGYVRSSAAEALGRLGDPSAIPALERALQNSNWDVQRAAAEALGRLGDPSAIPALECALQNSNWDVQRAAAAAMGRLGDPSAIPALKRALQDSNKYVQYTAAAALGRLGDPSAIPALKRALQNSDGDVRSAAAEALGRLGDPSAIPVLERALQNSSWGVRIDAAAALGRLGDPSAIPALKRALQDLDWRVRSATAVALGRLGDPSAIPALKRALQNSDGDVRSAAAAALGRLGDPSAIPVLKRALQDSSEVVRIAAAEALGRLGDPSAIPALKRALQDSNKYVQYTAAAALGRLGDPSAIPVHKRALQDSDVYARRNTAAALGRLGDPSAIPLLKRALLDSDEVVRINAAAALDQLAPGWDQGIRMKGQAALNILAEELNRQVSAIETESSESLGENLSHLPPWSGRDSHNKSFSATKLQELKAFIPVPEKLTLVGPTVEALKGLMAGILSNTPVYLMAVTGVGKNAMLRYLANRTGTPLYRINFGKDTDHGQLYGHFEVEVYENEAGEKKKRIVIQDGKMIEAIKNGGWCLWDEANLASEAFLVAQNDIIQQLKTGTVRVRQGGKLVTVPVHPHFRLFAAGNPEGYAARRPTEQSFGSRWLQVAVREFRVEEQQAILRDTLGTSLSPESVEHIPQVLHALKLATGGEAVTLRTLKRLAKRIGEVEAAGQEESPVHGASLWTHDASGRRQLSEFGIKAYVQAFESEVLDALSGDQHQNAVQALEQALARGEREIAPYLNSTLTQESFEQSVQDYRQEVQAKQATPVINSPHWEDLVPVPTTLKYAAKVLDSLRRGDNVLLEGPPAVSKSAIPKWLGKLLQQEVIEATGSPDHSSADMVGMPTLDERGNLVFQEGYVLRAIKSGAILILNEANLIPAEVMERLNSLLDDERMLMVTENGAKVPVKAHPNFRIVFTQNPAKMRGGRKQHSPAFENKVRKIVLRDGFPRQELEQIVAHELQRRLRGDALNSSPPSRGGPPSVTLAPESPGRSPAGGKEPQASSTSPAPVVLTGAKALAVPPKPSDFSMAGMWRGMATVFKPKSPSPDRDDTGTADPREVAEAEHSAAAATQQIQGEVEAAIQNFMAEHGTTLENLGSLAAMKRTRVQVDRSGKVSVAAMDLDSGVLWINPLAAREFTPRQIAAVAIHEGGHGAVSRVGDGFFFEKKSLHLLANCLEDPRVNEYMMERLPGSRHDFDLLYEKFFPDPARVREAEAAGEVPPLGGLPHEEFAHGFIDLWANGRVTERVTNPQVREALERLAPVARQIWSTHPDRYHPRERGVLAKQNEVYGLIREHILPEYESFYQASLQQVEQALAKQDHGGQGRPSGQSRDGGSATIDVEDLSEAAKKRLEERAGQMTEALEPQNTSEQRGREIERARRQGAAREGTVNPGLNQSGQNKAGERAYRETDFRPYDQKTFADVLKERAERKQHSQAFYDGHPYRRYFDPVRRMATQVGEALRQVLKLDTGFEYRGHYLSGNQLDIRKAVNWIIRDEAGVVSDEDLKLFLRKRYPTRRAHKFVLLLDESGSMKGEGIQASALQSMALFQHVMDQLKIDYAVAGFSESADLHKDFEEEMRGEKQLDVLMQELESAGGGSTNDLEGLKLSQDLLEGQEADEKTVIVVTDGAGVAETAAYVKQMEAQGIRVIAIGIGSGTEGVGKVYPNFYHSNDFRDLPKTLLAILVKRLVAGSR